MTGAKVNRVTVRTPEGVEFTFPLAGPVVRAMAWVIDTMAIGVIATLAGMVLVWFALISPDITGALLTLAYFIISTGYTMGLELLWRGQTLGKRVMHLRVMDAEGLVLTPGQVVMRNLVRVVDQLPFLYLVGGIAMMLSRRAQRLGDIAANTIVVRHRQVVRPRTDMLEQGRFNSLRESPHLAARLRQRVPPAIAAAAVDALLRRDMLEPEARVALFGELSRVLRSVVELPPQMQAEVPDEVFVRNVVEVVYTTAGANSVGRSRPA